MKTRINPLSYTEDRQLAEPKPATLAAGLELTRLMYSLLNKQYFVGLTGGLVYQEGSRKDIDIVIYRNRGTMPFEVENLKGLLDNIGLTEIRYFGFVTKAKWNGYDVDILHPESDSEFNYDGNP